MSFSDNQSASRMKKATKTICDQCPIGSSELGIYPIFEGAEDIAWNDEGKAAYARFSERINAISEATQKEITLFVEEHADGIGTDEQLEAFADGCVEIWRKGCLESSRAAADYYDEERLRQTGLHDGFKAKVSSVTDQEEREFRETVRQACRYLF